MSKTKLKTLTNLPYKKLPPERLLPILAKPHDDLPRLIAADWFEENDEREMADLIRYQIVHPTYKRKCRVDILAEHGSYAVKGYVNRGFVSELNISEIIFFDRQCVKCLYPDGPVIEPCVWCKGSKLVRGLWDVIGAQLPVAEIKISQMVYRRYMRVGAGYNIFGQVSQYLVPNSSEGRCVVDQSDTTEVWLTRVHNVNKLLQLRFPSDYVAEMLLSRAAVNLCRRAQFLPNIATQHCNPFPWLKNEDVKHFEFLLEVFYNPRMR